MYYILKAWKIIKRFAVDTMKTIKKYLTVNSLNQHTFKTQLKGGLALGVPVTPFLINPIFAESSLV